MAKKDASAAAALVPGENEQSGMAVHVSELDQLAQAFEGVGFDDDGLKEIDSDDLRLPIIVWNMKGKDDKTGELRRLDEFYDTLNEVSYRKITCALIYLRKTRLFSRFNNETNENVIYCSSNDRVTGRAREKHPDGLIITKPDGTRLPVVQGVERACETCPDADWHQTAAGKNVRNCDQVYGVYAVHLDEHMKPIDGFMIRFKRTGLQPFKTYMQKHHLGRREMPGGKRGHWPLYAFACELTLEVAKNGNYATPVLTKGDVLPQNTIQMLAQQAQIFAEIGDEATRAAERAEQRHEAGDRTGGGGGASTMSGDDFVS
jgi:hypothetical protein